MELSDRICKRYGDADTDTKQHTVLDKLGEYVLQ